MKEVEFSFAYMYQYSERPKTLAERKFEDDVPEELKKKRLQEVIDLQLQHSLKHNESRIGKIGKVLIEGYSKRSENDLVGRDEQGTKNVFPKGDYKKGQYVLVKATACTSATLMGEVVEALPPHPIQHIDLQ